MFRPPPGSSLIEVLGAGASFTVALVRVDDGTAIAKRLLSSGEGPLSAIDRERDALVMLGGVHAPRLLAAGEDGAGAYVIEAVAPGTRLSAGRFAPSREAPLERAIVARAVITAVEAVHQCPLVHADISPANLFLHGASATLIDFGSSGREGAPKEEHAAARGRGTLPYCAPELCREEIAPSHATDRYATAVLCAELLTGARLCTEPTEAAQLLAIGEFGHDREPIARSDHLPLRLREALHNHLELDALSRPRSLGALRAALDEWVDTSSASS